MTMKLTKLESDLVGPDPYSMHPPQHGDTPGTVQYLLSPQMRQPPARDPDSPRWRNQPASLLRLTPNQHTPGQQLPLLFFLHSHPPGYIEPLLRRCPVQGCGYLSRITSFILQGAEVSSEGPDP